MNGIVKSIVYLCGGAVVAGLSTYTHMRWEIDSLRAAALQSAAREAEHDRQLAAAMGSNSKIDAVAWQVSAATASCAAAKSAAQELLEVQKKAKPAVPAPSSPARTSPPRKKKTPTDNELSPPAAPSKAADGEGVQQALLDAHNKARQQAGVPPLVWSDDLAARAKAWAARLAKDGCRRQHSGGSLGENIYYAGPMVWSDGRIEYNAVPLDRPAAMWIAERDWWDASNRQCSAPAGETCGHYTQVVWQATEQMGCGMAVCGNKGQIWVCNYSPAGNVAGQNPY